AGDDGAVGVDRGGGDLRRDGQRFGGERGTGSEQKRSEDVDFHEEWSWRRKRTAEQILRVAADKLLERWVLAREARFHQVSERKGAAGRPAPLKRFATGLLRQA